MSFITEIKIGNSHCLSSRLSEILLSVLEKSTDCSPRSKSHSVSIFVNKHSSFCDTLAEGKSYPKEHTSAKPQRCTSWSLTGKSLLTSD